MQGHRDVVRGRGPRAKLYKGAHDFCKTGGVMFYNTLHFIAYYPALMQLGFIFSVKQSCIKKF
jgi:hypothetical protein